MKKFFKALLEKWSCKHKWEEYHVNNVYGDDDTGKLPIAQRVTLMCKNCGKIKRIYL